MVVGLDLEARLQLPFITGEDSGATDDDKLFKFWVYTDASEFIDIARSFITVERFDISLNGRPPSISFFISESSFCLSSLIIVPSPSSTCGNWCGECCLDLAELALDRNESHPLERVESIHCLLPLESTLGHES